MTHEDFMEKALAEAYLAYSRGEFPVGCIIVHENRVVASGARQGTVIGAPVSETDHAEILALKQLESAELPMDRHRLTLYSTLEPCLMCWGAILISGIRSVVYAYEDVMGGGTRCNLAQLPELYSGRPVTLVRHVLREQSRDLFKRYFSNPDNGYWKDSLLSRYTLDNV